MYSLILAEGTEESIRWVLWVVMGVFFSMTILGWLAASRGWLKDEEPAATESHHDGHEEAHEGGQA